MGMGRRAAVNGDEADAYGRMRRNLSSLSRAGKVKAIKRRTHKRERAATRNDPQAGWKDGR